MLMLQALHYRWCIILYSNVNMNFQALYSVDGKCLSAVVHMQ